MKGTFIVLEGGEGAGKSSVASFLKTQLPKERFLFTREPGGTPLAEKIRAPMISLEAAAASAETQLALAFAARFEHVQKVIEPTLAKGVNVISERFDSATYAYQIHGQKAPYLKPLFFECRKLLGDCVPDLYVWLDVEPRKGLARMRRNREKEEPIDQFEKREPAFHKHVRAGLLEFMKTVPSVTVDANRPLETVQRRVLQHLHKILSLK
jgi:dTMP kinase